jgi:hypothetical protein
MKKLAFFSVLISISILLTGCPYESDFPLSQPEVKIDSALIGSWVAVDFPQKGDIMKYKVFAFNQTEYLVESVNIKDGKNSEQEFFRAFISDLNGLKILNLQIINGNKSYIYHKYHIQDGNLYLSWLNDAYFKDKEISSSEDLQKVITANSDKADIFETENELKLSPFIEDK